MSDEHFEFSFKIHILITICLSAVTVNIVTLQSRPKFLWVVYKTKWLLKDFKVRKRRVSCVLFYRTMLISGSFQKHPMVNCIFPPGWWCHPGDIKINLEIFLLIWKGESGGSETSTMHRISAWDKELVQNVHRAEFLQTLPQNHPSALFLSHYLLPTGVTLGPVLFAALSKRAGP